MTEITTRNVSNSLDYDGINDKVLLESTYQVQLHGIDVGTIVRSEWGPLEHPKLRYIKWKVNGDWARCHDDWREALNALVGN